MSARNKRLLIAGGGTGGHLFPGIAIADTWEANGGKVLFVGTPKGLENRLLPQRGKRLALLKVGQLKGGGYLKRLNTLLGLPLALYSAWTIIRDFQPHVVLGMGGYASAPAVVAARLMRIPTALHEQNAIPGLTNRLLGKVADRVFVSFKEARSTFASHRVRLTGNPVRTLLKEESQQDQMPSGDRPFGLLIFGGSQGAQVFGDVMPLTLQQLQNSGVPIKVRHQVPQASLNRVRSQYKTMGLDVITEPFFHNMAQAYREADLVICRAGATTVAELAALGKPALLVPYPFASDDHQTANAKALITLGGGWMCRQGEFTPEWLAEFLSARMGDPEGLREAGKKALQLANPNSAKLILENLLDLVAKRV